MEPFTDFTYMKSMDLGSKANRSYRFKSLLNEQIDLTRYGDSVQSVLISPLIGSTLSPESEYIPHKKRLNVEFEIDPQKAMDSDEATYFQLMLESFIQALEKMERPEDFDFVEFKKDALHLIYDSSNCQ